MLFMPTYTYRCNKCKHEYDVFQSIKDKALTKCTECNGKVLRLIGAGAGILFKGSGFYLTDYRKDGNSKNDPAKTNDKLNTNTENATAPKGKDTSKIKNTNKSNS